MALAAEKTSGGLFEGLYGLIMRRNLVYVTFVIAGTFLDEQAVDYGVHKLWEYKNIGKRYENIPILGQRQSEERVINSLLFLSFIVFILLESWSTQSCIRHKFLFL